MRIDIKGVTLYFFDFLEQKISIEGAVLQLYEWEGVNIKERAGK